MTPGWVGYLSIRKNMVDDAIGYRAAGVTDFWTGITRWCPEAQKRVQKFFEGFMGHEAFARLKPKTTMIVRAFVIARDNLMSNVVSLSIRGVPLVTGPTKMREKYIETNQFVANKSLHGRGRTGSARSGSRPG